MRKRGQDSVEYTMIVAFALILVLPIAYTFLTSSTDDKKSDNAQIQHFAETVISQSERLYSMGPGAKVVINERLPKGAIVKLRSDDAKGIHELIIISDGTEYAYPTAIPINSSITEEDTAQGISSIRLEMKQRSNGDVYSWASAEPPCTSSATCSEDKFCLLEISECALCDASKCPSCYKPADHCASCVVDKSLNQCQTIITCGHCQATDINNICVANDAVGGCSQGYACSGGTCLQQLCGDGTPYGQCSYETGTMYCDYDGSFTKDCGTCCPYQSCNYAGNCNTAPITNPLTCDYAQTNGLCDGLDVLFGSGYKVACCTENSKCCA